MLAASLEGASALAELDLAGNEVGDAGTASLAQVPSCTTLHTSAVHYHTTILAWRRTLIDVQGSRWEGRVWLGR